MIATTMNPSETGSRRAHGAEPDVVIGDENCQDQRRVPLPRTPDEDRNLPRTRRRDDCRSRMWLGRTAGWAAGLDRVDMKRPGFRRGSFTWLTGLGCCL